MPKCGPKKQKGRDLLAKGSRIAKKRLREEHLSSAAPKPSDCKTMRAPAALGRDGKSMFRRICKLLSDYGALRSELREAIVAAAFAFDDFRAADKAVRKLGGDLTYKTSNSNIAAKPELKIRQDAFNRFVRALKLFDNFVVTPSGFESMILGGDVTPGGNGDGHVSGSGADGDPPYHDKDDPYWAELATSKDRFFSRAHIWKQYGERYGSVIAKVDGEWVEMSKSEHRELLESKRTQKTQ